MNEETMLRLPQDERSRVASLGATLRLSNLYSEVSFPRTLHQPVEAGHKIETEEALPRNNGST